MKLKNALYGVFIAIMMAVGVISNSLLKLQR